MDDDRCGTENGAISAVIGVSILPETFRAPPFFLFFVSFIPPKVSVQWRRLFWPRPEGHSLTSPMVQSDFASLCFPGNTDKFAFGDGNGLSC